MLYACLDVATAKIQVNAFRWCSKKPRISN